MFESSYTYAVKLTPAFDGAYVVTCRDLPDVRTCGYNSIEALEEAYDAILESMFDHAEKGIDLPVPTGMQEGELEVIMTLPLIVVEQLNYRRARYREGKLSKT